VGKSDIKERELT